MNNKAKDIIREASLQDYYNLFEANVDMGGTARSSSTSGGSNTSTMPPEQETDQVDNYDSSLDDGPTDKTPKKKSNSGYDVEIDDSGNARLYKNGKEVPPEVSDSFFRSNAWQKAKKAKSKFIKGYRSGVTRESMLDFARECIGLTETTTAGSVASMPSVVGDTSDSHKPTVQLRKRLKSEQEEERIKNNKKKRKKKNSKKDKEEKINRSIYK